MRRSYREEANYCRDIAAHFLDRPERPIILGMAEAFDDLARRCLLRPQRGTGPLGETLTLEKLPARNTPRWTVRRKAEVVAAVAGGILTADEACESYSLSFEEFASWQRAIQRSGLPGLRVTRAQDHRAVFEHHAASG